ncbi:MAG: hypothetical protein ABEJ06_05820 [Haloarculaceae archaeon]
MSEKTLRDVDHTHPDTDEAFGETVTYRRGPAPVRSDAVEESDDEDDDARRVTTDGGRTDETTLADVSHESGVQSVYERGPK